MSRSALLPLSPHTSLYRSSDTPMGKLFRGDTEPSSGEVLAYPLCALPAMTPAHGAATRPPPSRPRRPKPPASAAHAGGARVRGRVGASAAVPRCAEAAAGRAQLPSGSRAGPGPARTLRPDQRKQGRGWVLRTAREREVRVGSGAWGLRVPKNLVGRAGRSESSWVRTRGLRLPSSWP